MAPQPSFDATDVTPESRPTSHSLQIQLTLKMVSTRSTRSSTKHEAPIAENEALAKKQKVTTETNETAEANGKPEEMPGKDETTRAVTKSRDWQYWFWKELKTSNDTGKDQNGKPPAAEPESVKAEQEIANGSQRESKEAK
jgi:hypothetical protein